MNRLLPLLAFVALTGCASARQIDLGGEAVFQAAHLVDTLQTYHAATDDCYSESDPITRRLIGREPSRAGVIGWGVGFAAAHYAVTSWLLSGGHEYLAAAWEVVTIETTEHSVAQNIHVGIRIGAPNVHPGCPRARHGDVLLPPDYRPVRRP